MNGKRIAALAFISALVTTGAANAANPTGTVTIKWNTQQLASLSLVTNYSAAGAQQLTAPTIIAQLNGGTGACTATGTGSEAANTVNFGNVTPDASNTTDCLYENGVLAKYSTNDSLGYSLTVQETTAATQDAAKLLCYAPNGSQTSAAVVPSAHTTVATIPVVTTVTQTSVAIANTNCTGTNLGIVSVGAATIASAAAPTAGNQYAGGDIELALKANAPAVNDQAVATWTLVLN
jgi:hypothetical protein